MWSFSLLIVILGVVGISSYDKGCPAPEDISPCICGMSKPFEIYAFECYGARVTLEEVTSALQKLNHKTIRNLWLTDLKLDTFNSTLFQGMDIVIKKVRILGSKIGSFSDARPFRGLENSLEELSIQSSTIGGTIKLGHLHNLQTLKLERSDIPEINGDLFEDGLPSLRYLKALENTPRKIGSDAFAKLSNLRSLYIKHQSLETLERSLLPNPASALKYLELIADQVSDIDEDFLTNMPALEVLSLRGNKISTIDESIFKPILNEVEKIDLEENPIVCNSRLNWFIPLRKTTMAKFDARCYLPEKLRGRRVGKLRTGMTEYDP